MKDFPIAHLKLVLRELEKLDADMEHCDGYGMDDVEGWRTRVLGTMARLDAAIVDLHDSDFIRYGDECSEP